MIWIGIPLLSAAILFFIPRDRWVSFSAALIFLGLAAAAFLIPTDTALRFYDFSLRIDSTFSIFGRQISLPPSYQTILVLVFGMSAFWFFGTIATGHAHRLVPAGMAVISLLVASLAVQPFLYAALFLEMAVLIAVPALLLPGQRPGPGLLRFLIYQTLAMPFILFAGFLLSGIEASPGDVTLVTQSALMLGIGFSFLLAIFPLYTWLIMLAEETQPYALGSLLIVFPVFALLFGLNFIDRYSWLREAPQLSVTLRIVGLLMLVTSGLWAAFQRHLGRIMAYAIVAETGLSLLALSLADGAAGLQILFFMLLPRAVGVGVWALSLSAFKGAVPSLKYSDLRGLARRFPLATAGVVISHFSAAGMPLLASFPIRQALWEKLAIESTSAAIWLGIASLGLWIGAFRSLAVLTMASENTPWRSDETWEQRILIGLGVLTLFMLGLFPQWAQPLLTSLPGMFEHIGR
jgi:formate hydrogenlyase subunit 3/multisubunit Na+/H+ antiporter MnhD subunit